MNTAEKALTFWGLGEATVILVAARENKVFFVNNDQHCYALRLHRKGYRTNSELLAELDWMAMLDRAGLSVPTPIAGLDGSYLQIVDGVQVDVLTWLHGETLDAALPNMDQTTRKTLFRQIGYDMARMHNAIDDWPQSVHCDRPAWNSEGLLGDQPLWDRFWENAALSTEQKTQFVAFREYAVSKLTTIAPTLDYGLIHADLVPTNIMVSTDTLHFIDFDDGGFGFRLFEVATALLKHSAASDYNALSEALIDGYKSLRPLDVTHLPFFLALRAATYVGWNISRSAEDPTGKRNNRFVVQTEDLIRDYMATL